MFIPEVVMVEVVVVDRGEEGFSSVYVLHFNIVYRIVTMTNEA